MSAPLVLPFTAVDESGTSLMPLLTIDISYHQRLTTITGLLDTGSTVNVLPRSVGDALGANWEAIPTVIPLAGNLRRQSAKPLIVMMRSSALTAQHVVRLAFAWTETDDAPVLFGQMNFFAEFAVCFYRQHGVFEIHPKGG
jgi:hypothetical protein